MEPIYQEEHLGCLIQVFHDLEPRNPRIDCDNLGTMTCVHPRYNLGDPHGPAWNFAEPNEVLAHVITQGCVWLPLFLYDHSGLSMSTVPFHDRWDSMKVGAIYAYPSEVKRNFDRKRISKPMREKTLEIFRAEVEIYNHYLQSMVYGYEVFSPFGEMLDSCYGFYGKPFPEYMMEQARQAAEGFQEWMEEAAKEVAG